MIQRIQSLYLLLAVVLAIIAACEPVAYIVKDNALIATLFNYACHQQDGVALWWPACLLGLLLLVVILVAGYTIFAYKNRKKQMRLCNLALLSVVVYYAVLVVVAQAGGFLTEMTPSLFATFPLISGILCYMAKQRILKDERLVRAADRIR